MFMRTFTQKVKSNSDYFDIVYLQEVLLSQLNKETMVDKLEILAGAITYIEENLQSDIRTEDVAAACYCSKSTLEKMFRCVNNISVRDYLIRRRMMLAAKQIKANPEKNVLDIALECGYSTNESFSRAFRSIWNCNPSEFRESKHSAELYPKRCLPEQNGGTMMGKNVDISELYELFKSRKECYFVCVDIRSLVPINEISRKAGDLAILEAISRLEKEAGEEDVVFRIGGDEFVILTNQKDVTYASKLAECIGAHNGETFSYEEREIPLSLHIAVVKFEGDMIRYKDLFQQLHSTINGSKS